MSSNTRDQIKAERSRLIQASQKVEKEFRKTMSVIDRQLRDLEKVCPHPTEAAGSGSYSRWCSDCGWSEDTS